MTTKPPPTPYQIKLRDPRWKAKSRDIMKRDGFKCCFCNEAGPSIQVHHRYYIAKRSPWAYPDFALYTLCADCHGNAHDDPDQEKEWEAMAGFVFGTGESSRWGSAWEMACGIQITVNKGIHRERIMARIAQALGGGKA